ncbi:hypothetical protein NM688_g7631 [Phlebia brevispora]|uniref:Uncharacterized protein n=1 Tax=Phlebia brevispora TaxID=194682 RepID=A0ACC1S321_9APHY|nr:hypothetical protein NM688_g7631 [Phlebia brevispora]
MTETHRKHGAAIRLDGAFRNELDVLHPNVRGLGFVLDAWRAELTAAFYTAERDYASITSLVAADLYESFIEASTKMVELAKKLWGRVDAGQGSAVLCQKRALDESRMGDLDAQGQTTMSSAPTAAPPAKKARTRLSSGG